MQICGVSDVVVVVLGVVDDFASCGGPVLEGRAGIAGVGVGSLALAGAGTSGAVVACRSGEDVAELDTRGGICRVEHGSAAVVTVFFSAVAVDAGQWRGRAVVDHEHSLEHWLKAMAREATVGV